MREYQYPVFNLACSKWESFRKSAEQSATIREIERGCFNQAIKECDREKIEPTWENRNFVNIYSSICYRIFSNLNTCEKLVDAISQNPSIAAEIASWESSDLNAAANSEERQLVETRRNQKVDIKVTTQNKCPRCHTSYATAMEYQSRSIDEGSRVAYQCLACNKVFA